MYSFPNSVINGNYFIAIKHRSTLETWSASPVLFTQITNYDLSTDLSKANGNNQVAVAPSIYAMYSGDINQDHAIDAFDYWLHDPDIILGSNGYLSTDITGDGVVDAFDYILLDVGVIYGYGSILP